MITEAQSDASKNVIWPAWMGDAPRVNCPWSTKEEERMLLLFRARTPLERIAYQHGRKLGGISSRLGQLLGEEFWRLHEHNQHLVAQEHLDKLNPSDPLSSVITQLAELNKTVLKLVDRFPNRTNLGGPR